MKDKFGNKLTVKEYFKRWGAGIARITPQQQVNLQINSTWITLIGLIGGVIISIIGIRNLWWLLLILIGGLINTAVQQLGNFQRKKMLRQFDEAIELQMKGGAGNGN